MSFKQRFVRVRGRNVFSVQKYVNFWGKHTKYLEIDQVWDTENEIKREQCLICTKAEARQLAAALLEFADS